VASGSRESNNRAIESRLLFEGTSGRSHNQKHSVLAVVSCKRPQPMATIYIDGRQRSVCDFNVASEGVFACTTDFCLFFVRRAAVSIARDRISCNGAMGTHVAEVRSNQSRAAAIVQCEKRALKLTRQVGNFGTNPHVRRKRTHAVKQTEFL
jgi:hypothetical protein